MAQDEEHEAVHGEGATSIVGPCSKDPQQNFHRIVIAHVQSLEKEQTALLSELSRLWLQMTPAVTCFSVRLYSSWKLKALAEDGTIALLNVSP